MLINGTHYVAAQQLWGSHRLPVIGEVGNNYNWGFIVGVETVLSRCNELGELNLNGKVDIQCVCNWKCTINMPI